MSESDNVPVEWEQNKEQEADPIDSFVYASTMLQE